MWHVIYAYTYTCTNGRLSWGGVLDNMMSYTHLYCSSLQFLLLFLFIDIRLLNCHLHNAGYMPATSYLDVSTFILRLRCKFCYMSLILQFTDIT